MSTLVILGFSSAVGWSQAFQPLAIQAFTTLTPSVIQSQAWLICVLKRDHVDGRSEYYLDKLRMIQANSPKATFSFQ